MPPADDRCTSFRHDEALLPTLCSTLPSRRAARGPLPWWGAGLRGTVMSLLLILCRRAGCHRRCFFVEGNRSAEHDINQIVFPFPRFTPIRVPLWKLNNLCIHSASIRLSTLRPLQPLLPVRCSYARQISPLIGQCPCKLSLGGPCSTEVAAPPTESIGLPSRLRSLGW